MSYNGGKSAIQRVKYGIPQGSIDTIILISGHRSFSVLSNKLLQNNNVISNWFNSNKLNVNIRHFIFG